MVSVLSDVQFTSAAQILKLSRVGIPAVRACHSNLTVMNDIKEGRYRFGRHYGRDIMC